MRLLLVEKVRRYDRIRDKAKKLHRFVRVSSEFPFLPGRIVSISWRRAARWAELEVRAGFLHSSDLDPTKLINRKRQVAFCGAIGVMGDLGIHVAHVPLRLGWKPRSRCAQLQKIYTERPDGKGGTARCDTWDNALPRPGKSALGVRQLT